MSGAVEAAVREAASAAGFDAVAIARLADHGDGPGRRLDAFLAGGRHGDMGWMETSRERRRHPQALWPEARSAVVVGLSYAPDHDPLAVLAEPARGAVSVYAQGRDYHDIVKPGLKRIAAALQRAAPDADVKVFVDTAPLMEKPLAALAGLGWQGRHTNLVSRAHGSWLFLGVVLTTAELQPDTPEADHCGSCRRCLDVCPTDAFPAPYQLDARRCIAYLTIEHKGPIPRAFRAAIGNRVFGCDDCLAVCPWNKFAAASREQRLAGTESTRDPRLAELLALDDAAFRRRFAGTPVKRTGRDRVLRNALIATGNSDEPSLLPAAEGLLDDTAALVRGAAVWAVARLAGLERLARLAVGRRERETDLAVAEEWRQELGP